MVDFRKLRSSQSKDKLTNPLDVFLRLPKTASINDLYQSQAAVLREWHDRRTERDILIKLPTGGGKTLVGLLIAQSTMNEHGSPVLYLVPNRQLVGQTVKHALSYGIQASAYDREKGIPAEFHNGQAVLVATYQALFNGRSKFGIAGQTFTPVEAGAIVFDDAHVSFDTIREAFTIEIERKNDAKLIDEICSQFRSAFEEIERVGIFDDVVKGQENSVLEIPYWSWKSKLDIVREFLKNSENITTSFPWPLIRDHLVHCVGLIGKEGLVISPHLPFVDEFPTFRDCPRRVYMSATIADDSEIIRTFGADEATVAKPITAASIAGIGERMILIPSLMKFGAIPTLKVTKEIATQTAKEGGVVVLVPSKFSADEWRDTAVFPDTPKAVTEKVTELQNQSTRGPVVLANRYDGIDLPDESCRLLVLWGLPRGASAYDMYRSSLLRGVAINSTIAQRIEQGLGRGARGPNDFCVIIIGGNDLVSWIGRRDSLKFLSSATRVQIEIGQEVSRSITSVPELWQTTLQSLQRNPDWIAFHADRLAEAAKPALSDEWQIRAASVERQAMRLTAMGHPGRALVDVDNFLSKHQPDLAVDTRAWMFQLAGRLADLANDRESMIDRQTKAYKINKQFVRAPSKIAYQHLTAPSSQATRIVGALREYHLPRAMIARLEEVASQLTSTASSNQYEQALCDLGVMLGFESERPERDYGTGPDVLWLTADDVGFVIEVKSRKKAANALTKTDHAQLLEAEGWFKGQYAKCKSVRVCVHPNLAADAKSNPEGSFGILLTEVLQIVKELKVVIEVLAGEARDESTDRALCEALLQKHKLTGEKIRTTRLKPFQP